VIAMARKPTTPPKLREWRIVIIRAKIVYLGRVMAPDNEAAIDKAMEEFKIDEAQRFKVIAQPVD